jgi:hypothetical protein
MTSYKLFEKIMNIENDILDLHKYLKGHHERLNLDIHNAEDRESPTDVAFYEGAKGATHLILHLIEDILQKNNCHFDTVDKKEMLEK